MTTFILVNPEREVSSIAVLISFRGKKYKKSTGESVRVRQWSTAKKRVKVTAGNTEAEMTNEKLDLWEKAAMKTISYFKEKTYIPDSGELVSVLEEYHIDISDETEGLTIDPEGNIYFGTASEKIYKLDKPYNQLNKKQ